MNTFVTILKHRYVRKPYVLRVFSEQHSSEGYCRMRVCSFFPNEKHKGRDFASAIILYRYRIGVTWYVIHPQPYNAYPPLYVMFSPPLPDDCLFSNKRL